ncbi:alpha/beta fold hydrolase [Noviherbaspirillum aerium]|uniref:alpha/beta fold hydrolase n=1 Tax=Noviherbaspirillum aerium TaxID=2588497 RepID=UPI00124D512B|nr:alpha/beta hydrolase [Noviherbaspirillum aerium]
MNALDVFRGLSEPRRIELTEAEAQLLRSGTPQSFPAGEGALAGWSWGTAGPRILLVHGWESRASHLGQWVAPLCRAGFQVWGFDGPAHGDSPGTLSSVVHHGKALLEIAGAYGPFSGVVAHSVGSPAALYAFHNGMRVCSSVHIAGPASLERVIHRFAQAAGLDAVGTDQLHRLTEAHIGQPIASMELGALVDGLRHPALLLHDPADHEVPYAESCALTEIWRGARLVAIPGVGHRRIIAHTEAIAAAVAHLASTIPIHKSAAEKVTADD